jgi:hypothetical protein
MPDPTVAAIEALRVYAVELAHPLGMEVPANKAIKFVLTS